MDHRAKRIALVATIAAAAVVVGLVLISRGPAPTPEGAARRADVPRDPVAEPSAPGAAAPARSQRGPRAPEVDVAAMREADPRALAVRTQVLRALDDLAAPVAIRRITCVAVSCDVVLEAKSREDAGVVIDRLSEPGHGFAGEAESMTLHEVHEDAAGVTVFGFTLAF